MATHSSVLAWRIPGTGELGGLPSMGSHRVRHDWSDVAETASQITWKISLEVNIINHISYPKKKKKKKRKDKFWNQEEKKESEIAQSCPSLCDPMYCSPPGSSIHGIFQTRVLEWVAISFSRLSSWPRDQTWVSCIAGKCFYHLKHQGGRPGFESRAWHILLIQP